LEAIPTPAARSYIESLGKIKKTPWKQLFPTAPDLALDLLDKLLAFNPKKRISVDDALKHPYFRSLQRDVPDAVPECSVPFDFSWEKKDLNEKMIQDLMWQEIYQYRPELKEERAKGIEAGSIRPYEKPKADREAEPAVVGAGGRRDSVAAAAAAAEAASRAEKEEQAESHARHKLASVSEDGPLVSAAAAAVLDREAAAAAAARAGAAVAAAPEDSPPPAPQAGAHSAAGAPAVQAACA
jgi:hypothetical protein